MNEQFLHSDTLNFQRYDVHNRKPYSHYLTVQVQKDLLLTEVARHLQLPTQHTRQYKGNEIIELPHVHIIA